ncbi:MAG: hypothetical protein ACRCX2_38185 [Paraclostridium sp.]
MSSIFNERKKFTGVSTWISLRKYSDDFTLSFKVFKNDMVIFNQTSYCFGDLDKTFIDMLSRIDKSNYLEAISQKNDINNYISLVHELSKLIIGGIK